VPITHYNEAIVLRQDVSDVIGTLKKPGASSVPNTPASGNSVKKKGWFGDGLVISTRLQGSIDFTREEAAQRKLKSDEPGGWFSYQKRVGGISQETEDAALLAAFGEPTTYTKIRNLFLAQDSVIRSFSMYEKPLDLDFNDEDVDEPDETGRHAFSVQKTNITPDFMRWVQAMATSDIPEDEKLVNFSCAIHQVMHIHFLLYKNGWVHGDMHMKNMKVIDPGLATGMFLVKAFDFGESGPANFANRNNDLNYLFWRRSQKTGPKGFGESMLRANRGEDHADMQKHYPIHKIMKTMGVEIGMVNDFMASVGSRLTSRLSTNNLTLHQPWIDISNEIVAFANQNATFGIAGGA